MIRYLKVQMYIPGPIFDVTVQALRSNGFKVDDLCDVCRDGRAIDVWIPEERVTEAVMAEHCGYFIGEDPERPA